MDDLQKPLFGFQFNYLKDARHGSSVLERMGALNSYPEVRAFQITYNLARRSSESLPVEQRIPGLPIDEDGIYAGETDGALMKYVTYLVRRGHTGCGSVTSAEVRNIGPSAVRQCLVATGMADSAVSVMQRARDEWKAGSGERLDPWARQRADCTSRGGTWNSTTHSCVPAAGDPYAAARAECASRGGTWNDTTNTCTAAGAKDEGMGTGTWILLIALGAAVAGGIYYVATET